MSVNNVKMTFKYADDTTRQYTLSVDEDDLMDVEDNIIAINTSLTGGTSGGLNSFFVAAGGASFVSISGAQIISEEETVLDLSGGGN